MAETSVRIITIEAAKGDAPLRSSVGGRPHLAAGEAWPTCRTHGVPLVLFFQIDAADAGAPLRKGEHLLVFQCPQWNDIPEFAPVKPGEPLPDAFWDAGEGHYAFLLNTDASQVLGSAEKNLTHSAMTFQEAPEETQAITPKRGEPFTIGRRAFKVGGTPSWAQGPQTYRCRCGADMELLVEVPLNFIFPKTKEAPEQPGTYSDTEYMLFLGNETYLFGCTKRCDPRAVFAVVQN
jgi:hypothetical protein